MRFDLVVAGRTAVVELFGDGSAPRIRLDGREVAVAAEWISPRQVSLLIAGRSYDVAVQRSTPDRLTLSAGGRVLDVCTEARGGDRAGAQRRHAGGVVASPMPGKVIAVLVKPGDEVSEGQGLIVVEAMKMENELPAPGAGIVRAVHASVGQIVEAGTALIDIAALASDAAAGAP